MTLRISPTLALPDDFVTKTCAILAQRRKGKTYTASVIAEEFVANEIPFVALDPTGAWWGLRAAANGRDEGLPVVILGGAQGDVPLERNAGKFVAELVVTEPGFYVIDFTGFESGAAEKDFATDFAKALYRRKGQPGSDFALHLLVDEADRFAPQRILDRREQDQAMLGAFETIVRRGGLRGLGTTLISQRPAVLNKNVLEQADVLIFLRVVGPNDQKAVREYVKAHGTPEEIEALMGSLASLELGEAWVWEPGGDPPLFERVKIRERHTFNSSATPKTGETRVVPKRLAAVDLDRIKEQMAETIERARADDPKVLRKRIIELERAIDGMSISAPPPVVEYVEVPVLSEATVNQLKTAFARPLELLESIRESFTKLPAGAKQGMGRARGVATPAPQRPDRPASVGTPTRQRRSTLDVPPASGAVSLGKGERATLTAIAQHDAGVTREQLTVLTGYKRSTRNTYLQRLGVAGFADVRGSIIYATSEGVAALGDDFEPLPTGAALREHWLRELPKGEREILAALIDVYPSGLDREEISERTGFMRSTRNTYIQRLGARQLVTTDGDPRVADVLFDGAR